jgi:hypothetical protein
LIVFSVTRPARAREAGTGGAISWVVKAKFVIATLQVDPGRAEAIEPLSDSRSRESSGGG